MRQLVAESEPDENGCLCIEGKKFHYLNSVLRLACGDIISVRLPGGALVQMSVADADEGARKMTLQSLPAQSAFQENPAAQKGSAELFLFQFIARPPKMDLIVRQAAECGVAKIIPVEGTFCQKGSIESARKKSADKDDRWQRIITEARQQSGSPVETRLLPPVSVEQACALWQEESGGQKNSAAVVLYERDAGTKTVYEAVKNADVIKSEAARIAVAVGAEGGISAEEISVMKKSGFIPVHLATNILRCETASLYGIAALQTVFSGE